MTPSAHLRPWRDALMTGGFATLVSLAAHGVNSGIHDHSILIPLVRRLADRSAYPGDYLFESLQGYATLFYRLLAMIRPTERGLEMVFVGGACLLVAAALVIWSLYGTLRGCSPAGVAAGACVLAAGYNPSVGHSWLEMNMSHALPGIVLGLAAFALMAAGRRMTAYVALGVALNLHGMYALFVLALILAALMLERPIPWAHVVLAPATVALLGTPILLSQAGSVAASDLGPWIEILRVRSPHHVFLAGVAPIEWVQLATYGLLLLRPWRRGRDEWHRLDVAAILVAALGLIAAALFIDGHPLEAFVRLHPMRATFWLYLATLPRWVRSVSEGLMERRPAAAMAVAVAVAGLLGRPWSLKILALLFVASVLAARASGRDGAATFVSRVYLAAVGVLSAGPLLWLVAGASPPGIWPDTGFHTLMILVAVVTSWAMTRRGAGRGASPSQAAAAIGVIAVTGALGGWLDRGGAVINRPSADWVAVQHWAREHTEPGTTFIVPIHREGFRVASWRNQYVDWKDGTLGNFSPAFAERWSRRLVSLGIRLDAAADRDRAGTADETLEASDYCRASATGRADYVVTDDARGVAGLPEVYEAGPFRVYRLTCAPPAS